MRSPSREDFFYPRIGLKVASVKWGMAIDISPRPLAYWTRKVPQRKLSVTYPTAALGPDCRARRERVARQPGIPAWNQSI